MRKELEQAKQAYLENKREAIRGLDEEALKEKTRAIRETSVKKMVELWKEARKNLEASGVKTHYAENAEQAIKAFKKIVNPNEQVVKTKSNTIKELGLLKKIDNQVTETDCGDLILNICEEEPEHPVTPAITLNPQKIVKKIKQKTGDEVEPSAKPITEWVRDYVKPKILNADVGLTGANAVTSEGSVFILENEGNISLASRLPPKHVIITSLDKLVRTNEDATTLMKTLSVFGTGSRMASYVNIISGPSKTADVQKQLVQGMQGAREVHLIMVDNGRTQLVEQGLGEALLCIGCGSCLYHCPAYQQLLKDFGNDYVGPKGLAMEKNWEKLYSCTACLACQENCPVSIDLLEILRKKRSMIESPENERMIENVKRTGNPFGDEPAKPGELYCC